MSLQILGQVIYAFVESVFFGVEVGVLGDISLLIISPLSNDSGPTFTSNVAPKNRTTRIKTSNETLRALKMLEIFI